MSTKKKTNRDIKRTTVELIVNSFKAATTRLALFKFRLTLILILYEITESAYYFLITEYELCNKTRSTV